MKLAFYKGTGYWFDRITRFVTRGRFSHVELVFSDGVAASASFRDKGVRFKRIEFDPARWVFRELDVSDPALRALLGTWDQAALEEAARAWFSDNEGAPYDVLGLAGFVWRRITGLRRARFCSEAVMEALGFAEAWRFCPNTMAAVFLRDEF